MAFRFIFGDDDGAVYAVTTAGDLYWTPAMFDTLEAYVAQGGRVLYLGGNGIYERVAYVNNFRQMRLRDNATNARDLFRDLNPPRPERAILGV